MAIFDEDSAQNYSDNLEQQQSVGPDLQAPGSVKEGQSVELTGQEFRTLEARSAEQNNWVISLFKNGFGDWTKSDENFNPYEYIKDTKYTAHPDYFINADNVEDIEQGKRQVDELEQYQDLYSRSGSTGFWSAMAWGMADPLIAVPGIALAKAARIGKLAYAATSIAKSSALAATTMAVSEAALQASQPERTATDSAINIAAAGVVGGAFGGIIGAKEFKAASTATKIADEIDSGVSYSAAIKSQSDAQLGVKKVLEAGDDSIPVNYDEVRPNIANADDYKSIDEILGEHSDGDLPLESISTKTGDDIQPIDEEELQRALTPTGVVSDLDEPAQGIGADYVARDARVQGIPPQVLKTIAVPHVINPSIEGLASPSATVRDLTSRLGYMHFPLQNAKGDLVTTPFSLESRMQQDMLQGLDFAKQLDRNYLQYLQIDPDAATAKLTGFVYSKSSKVLKSNQFDEAIMDAMNAGDRHDIPQVQEAAVYSRKLVNDTYKRMQDVGLIDKDKPPFPNWFKVVYDMNGIINDRMGFEKALTRRLVSKVKAEVQYTKNGKTLKDIALYDIDRKELNWVAGEGESLVDFKTLGQLAPEEARSIASDSTDNILQMGDRNLTLGDIDRLSFTRGTDSGKPRKIVMNEADYQALKPWLVKDFRRIMNHYLSSTSRAVNYKGLLDDLGVSSIQDLRVRARDEFKEKMYKVENYPEIEPDKLKDLPKSDRKNYLTRDRKTKLIAKLNKQAISSEKLLNDLVSISLGQFKKRSGADPFLRTVNQYNVARLYGGILTSSLADPFSMLIKNSIPKTVWRGWLAQLRQFATGTSKLKQKDYRNALTAIQNEVDDLTKFLVNPDMSVYDVNKYERFGQVAANIQMKAQGMTIWNNFWQRASHNLVEYNILDAIKNPTKKAQALLKEVGIDDSMAKRINAMQEKYGQDIKGTHISNSHQWSDVEAANYFNNAIRTDVHKSPLISEMLDLPRFFQRSELRKSMALGKGFTYGAITKIGMNAGSRRDLNAMAGILSMVVAGMAVQLLKDKMKGKMSDYSLAEWIKIGMDRSGVLGMLGDPLFQAITAHQNIKKYGQDAWITEPMDYILGPNASIINPAYRAIIQVPSIISGEKQGFDSKTNYQLKSLIPFNKLWYLQNQQKKR